MSTKVITQRCQEGKLDFTAPNRKCPTLRLAATWSPRNHPTVTRSPQVVKSRGFSYFVAPLPLKKTGTKTLLISE